MNMENWISWSGGECPVAQWKMVDVRNRAGLVENGIEASKVHWQWDNVSLADVIAYRLIPLKFSSGIRCAKKYRIYFNSRDSFPQIWMIDEGSWHTAFAVQFLNIQVPIATNCDEQADNKKSPFAWIEAEGYLRMEGATAIISREA